MTDRELLKLAAKAAGYVGDWKFLEAFNGRTQGWYFVLGDGITVFSPLTDDGDALRLAVKLKLELSVFDDYVFVFTPYEESIEVSYTDDPAKALRYAITKAACGMCEA